MNDKPFSHACRFGTEFIAYRCDFVGGIKIKNRPSNQLFFASDVAEMIGFHAVNIRPELNGFQGYDCIQWSVATEK